MRAAVEIRVLDERADQDRQILHRVHAVVTSSAPQELTQGELIAATKAMLRRMGWVPA